MNFLESFCQTRVIWKHGLDGGSVIKQLGLKGKAKEDSRVLSLQRKDKVSRAWYVKCRDYMTKGRFRNPIKEINNAESLMKIGDHFMSIGH